MNWREIANKAGYWLLPPGFKELIRFHLLQWPAKKLTPEELAVLHRNVELRNRHQGERCFILATGPSIKDQDLRPLQGENCIAVSNFFVHEDYQTINPQYYCLAPLHSPYTDDDGRRWFREMEGNVGSATMLLSYSDRHIVENGEIFLKQSVHYLCFDDRCDFESHGKKKIDLEKPLPLPQTATIIALQVALYLGFKTVYLLGVDHSWPRHIGKSAHFHDESARKVVPEHPEVSDYEGFFIKLANLLRKYKIIKLMAERQGCTIYNATPNSMLDVFEPARHDVLFSGR